MNFTTKNAKNTKELNGEELATEGADFTERQKNGNARLPVNMHMIGCLPKNEVEKMNIFCGALS